MYEPLDEKYTFSYKNNHGETFTMELENVVVLSDILEKFGMFLRGSGFCFSGNVDIVDDNIESNKEVELPDEQ